MLILLLILGLFVYYMALFNKRRTVKRGDRIGRFLVLKVLGNEVLLTDGESEVYIMRRHLTLTGIKGLK